MKTRSKVTVKQGRASPVVTFPTPTVTSVRRPLTKPGATVSQTRAPLVSERVTPRRGVTVKQKK